RAGEIVVVEAVVIGDYQERFELQGFFIQEEDADADDDPATAEGVFVDSRLIQDDVQVGDVVRFGATVGELSDGGTWMTQLSRIKHFQICESGVEVTPTEVLLPLASADAWEQYEGMLVTFTQELTVTQLYNLGRYGEVLVSAYGRLYQPTNVARPGPNAEAVADMNARLSFYLDDAGSNQNADPTLYPPGGLSAESFLRSGDTFNGVTGVLDQRNGYYRLYPVEVPEFVPTNPRIDAPEIEGRLRVASFNVLNYFNGDGAGGGFPTERGADNADELARQEAKIVAALVALDADVIGLMEIENDDSSPDSATAQLTRALNEALGEDVYAYIADPADQPVHIEDDETGGDAIKQAIIYRTATVQPIGDAVTTLDAPFDARRPTVAQAFEEVATGEVFIVSVNHFKSKGCPGPGLDGDQDDGQSCWNAERVLAAQTLSAWFATDPTGTGDPDVLVIGDLNAYAMEDPLIAFAEEGYTNLVLEFEGLECYSYVYYGRAGSLDHALASASLLPQVTGAQTWHINADEVKVLDYNTEYKTDNHIESLFAPNAYRSSDHDPVVVGLTLDGDQEPEPTEEPTEEPAEEPDQDEATPDDATDDAADDASVDDDDDNIGGIVAMIGGIIAVALAIVGGVIGARRRSRQNK
ncbi:MAG: ExeM/NucH family extracellular endonuclease, partial [Anaerolineae bacterium]|nr:ExeM/NucH family extracellular endonuclease [Anaerolineae bacterium]